MNKEFKRRQNQVLEILSIIARKADERNERLVFLGGSAIQTAVLKEPKRLSVDLDIYYEGDAVELLKVLEPDYKIESRPAKRRDLFSYYKAEKGDALVKIDIARFPISESGKPYEKKTLKSDGKQFELLVGTADYLLAAKLSALAIGTIGRKGESIDFLKDVSDAYWLIEEFKVPRSTWKYFAEICGIQNRIMKTNFKIMEIVESAEKALQASALTDETKSTIKKGDFGNFTEYLFTGAMRRPEYWLMAMKVSTYLAAFKQAGTEGASDLITQIEENIGKYYADKKMGKELTEKLMTEGLEWNQLHELILREPKAFFYFYAFKHPEEFSKMGKENQSNKGPISTNSRGVYNPRFS